MDTLIVDSMVDSGVPGREENVETVTTVEGNGIHATHVSNQDTVVLFHYP
jgi:hypothetical protein